MLKYILDNLHENSLNINNTTLKLNDQLKSLIENVSSNIMNIIYTLIALIAKESQLKQEISTGMIQNLQGEFLNDYEEIKKKNLDLERMYSELNRTHSYCVKEMQILKTKESLNISFLNEAKSKIDEMNNKIFSLQRKVNSNPRLPFIFNEKSLMGKEIEEHECVCQICSTTMNDKKHEEVISAEESLPARTESDEFYKSLQTENEALKSRIFELNEIIEKLKVDSIITFDKLTTSRPFVALIEQGEEMMTQIDYLRETNLQLQKQKMEIQKEKENEIKQMGMKYNEKLSQYAKNLSELNSSLEKEKILNGSFSLRITSLENLLKSKESIDFNSIYESYNSEKQKLIKQIESIKAQKREYAKKYEEESDKIKNYEKQIYKLNGEIDKYKSQIDAVTKSNASVINVSIQPDDDYKNDKYNKYKIDLKKKEDKISYLKKILDKTEGDLKTERENSEKLIMELEVNENGLEDLNKKIKSLTLQLQEANEKIARMTNEKLKDMNTMKTLNESKEILELKNKETQSLLENYKDFTHKLESELNVEKESLLQLEKEIKRKDEEILSLQKEMEKAAVNEENTKMIYNQCLMQLKESQRNSVKNAHDYEQIKVKYEELVKLKKFVNCGTEGNEHLLEEIKALTMERDKYTVIFPLTLEFSEMQSVQGKDKECYSC